MTTTATATKYQYRAYSISCGNYCGIYAEVLSIFDAKLLQQTKTAIADNAPDCPVCRKHRPVVVINQKLTSR